MYRQAKNELEVFLVHPGGPYFQKRQAGFWGIPKGLVEPEEAYLTAAKREFQEETSLVPQAPFVPLGSIQYRSSRKIVHAWGFEGDWQPEQGIKSNSFQMEWPPYSGQYSSFPEVDEARWFGPAQAKVFMHQAQHPLLDRLILYLNGEESKP